MNGFIYDQKKLHLLSELGTDRLDSLLDALQVDFTGTDTESWGPCPVHSGDNPTGCKIFASGDRIRGNWSCYTHNCQVEFCNTLVGFVRGVLSNRHLGWSQPGDKKISLEKTISFLCDFLGVKFDQLQADEAPREQRQFIRQVSRVTQKTPPPGSVRRDALRERLVIPSPYFLERGFSASILDEFDIGDCIAEDKPFTGRAVVPVYGRKNDFAIGLTGRAIPEELKPKWFHSKDFQPSNTLYNLHGALPVIAKTRTVILVEGPGDVLRLVEAGFRNAVALFGCHLSDAQQVLLEATPAMNVVLLTDNDDAGEKAFQEISARLGRFYRIHRPKYSGKDVGSVEPVKLRKELAILEKIYE